MPRGGEELKNESGENYGAFWVLRESDRVWYCRGFHSRASPFHSPSRRSRKGRIPGKEGKTAFSASAERSEVQERWAYVF